MEPFKYHGVWWSPVYGRRVPGELTFTPEGGLHLVVQGSLTTATGRDVLEHYPVLLGRAANGHSGGAVTLLDAYAHQRSDHGYRGPALITERLQISRAFMGVHLRTRDECKFDRAEIEFYHLNAWTDIFGFAVGQKLDPYTVTYVPPEIPLASVDGGDIRLTSIAQFSGGFAHELDLRETAMFDLTFREPVDINEIHSNWFFPLQNLITLAIGEPTWVTAVRLYSRRFRDRGTRDVRPLRFYYLQSFVPEATPEIPRLRQQLFRFTDIRAKFSSGLASWLKSSRELRPFMEVFFGERYHPAKYERARLLTLSLALEGLHRATHRNELRPKADYRAFVEQLTMAIPEEHRVWLSEQLAHANEPRLRQRILELCRDYATVIGPIVGDLEDFAALVATSRNEVAHTIKRRRRGPSVDLYWVLQTLEVLCEAFLLTQLGLTHEEIATVFERNEPYRIIRRFGLANTMATEK